MQKLEKIANQYNISPYQICNLDIEGRLYLHERHKKYLHGSKELAAFMTYEHDISYITFVPGNKLEEHLESLQGIRPGTNIYEISKEQGTIRIPEHLRMEKNIGGLAGVEGNQDALRVYNLDEYARHLQKIKKEGFDDLSFLPPETKI